MLEQSRPSRPTDQPLADGLTIIVPAFNEEHGIARVVTWIRESLEASDLRYEVLVVDDGSADATAVVAESAGARVIPHDSNRGYGEALKTGIRFAEYERIAIIDADGSYPADQIPKLAQLLDRYDMVVGARTKEGAAIPLVRRPAKKFLNWLASYLTGTHIPDLNSGLRIFRKALALEFIHLLPSGFSFTTTITMAALNNNYRVLFEPVDYFKRTGRSKIRPIQDTLNFLFLILRMTLIFRPLKIYLPVALVFFVLGIAVFTLGLSLAHKVFDNTALGLILVGVNAMMIGMLADLVNVRLRR
ncbi:MAG: glycosyltransferase family 2 protein [Chloroflexi bacterium]|nr:glycosyltransferase family 2 protein [Chloroflexota bacterium]